MHEIRARRSPIVCRLRSSSTSAYVASIWSPSSVALVSTAPRNRSVSSSKDAPSAWHGCRSAPRVVACQPRRADRAIIRAIVHLLVCWDGPRGSGAKSQDGCKMLGNGCLNGQHLSARPTAFEYASLDDSDGVRVPRASVQLVFESVQYAVLSGVAGVRWSSEAIHAREWIGGAGHRRRSTTR